MSWVPIENDYHFFQASMLVEICEEVPYQLIAGGLAFGGDVESEIFIKITDGT